MGTAILQRTPRWVAEAAALPLAFAQVREDAEVDRWVVRAVQRPCRVVMTASGGCTAAALASEPNVSRLDLVDLSPAQTALSRLKLRLLRERSPAERLALLGHAPMDPRRRLAALECELGVLGLSPEALGPAEALAARGPDHLGRYERLFAALRADLAGHAEAIEALMTLSDTAEQERRTAPGTDLGRALDGALARTLAQPNLEALFPAAAAAARAVGYAAHFAARIRWSLANLPAADNPYLSQVLLGRFRGPVVPWLAAPRPGRHPEAVNHTGDLGDYLDGLSAEADVVHLSNALDWLTPERAAVVLASARRALRPGGWVVLRQLNSTHDIPALGEGLRWLDAPSRSLHASDRSFLYQRLWVGSKP